MKKFPWGHNPVASEWARNFRDELRAMLGSKEPYSRKAQLIQEILGE